MILNLIQENGPMSVNIGILNQLEKSRYEEIDMFGKLSLFILKKTFEQNLATHPNVKFTQKCYGRARMEFP